MRDLRECVKEGGRKEGRKMPACLNRNCAEAFFFFFFCCCPCE